MGWIRIEENVYHVLGWCPGNGIARVSWEYQSVMTNVYWLPWSFFGCGRSLSIAMMPRGPGAGKNWNRCLWQYRFLFWTLLPYSKVVVQALLAVSGQQYVRLNVSYIRSWPGCPAIQGWCARYSIRACSEVGATVWTAMWDIEFWKRSPRWSLLSLVLASATLRNLTSSYWSSACLVISFSSVEGVTVDRSSCAISWIMLSVPALKTILLMLSPLSSDRSRCTSSMSDVSFSPGVCKWDRALEALRFTLAWWTAS